jgi:hypothetical protein
MQLQCHFIPLNKVSSKAILSATREKNLRVSSLPDARYPHQIYPLEESFGIVFLLMQIEKKARLLAHG